MREDPYCFPGRTAPVEKKEETPEPIIETEKTVVSVVNEQMSIVDEVVEYEEIQDKIEEAPNLETARVDLKEARVVSLDDDSTDKSSEDAVFKSDEEIVIERKDGKDIWKPPDAED
jgi:hypothetical protein